MRTIHIGRNGQSLGTFPEDKVRSMLLAGQLLPTDLAWTEGMANWLPLGQAIQRLSNQWKMMPLAEGELAEGPLPAGNVSSGQLAGAQRPVGQALTDVLPMEAMPAVRMPADQTSMRPMPVGPMPVSPLPMGESIAPPLPVLPAGRLHYRPNSPENGDPRPLPWKRALIYSCSFVVSFFAFLVMMWVTPENEILHQTNRFAEFSMGLTAMMGISLLLMVVFGYILHYRCWMALPPRYRYLPPGLAVGLVFIPIFNFIWIFFMYHRLARGYRDWSEEVGIGTNSGLVTQAIILACFWDFSWLPWTVLRGHALSPYLFIMSLPAMLVLYIFFYRGIVKQAHAIHGN